MDRVHGVHPTQLSSDGVQSPTSPLKFAAPSSFSIIAEFEKVHAPFMDCHRPQHIRSLKPLRCEHDFHHISELGSVGFFIKLSVYIRRYILENAIESPSAFAGNHRRIYLQEAYM